MNKRWLSAWLLCALFSCGNPAVEIKVTAEWPDGTPKRVVSIANGDTIEVAINDAQGRLTKVSRWRNGKAHGVWESFYPDGTTWSRHEYHEGVQLGQYQTWHPNGLPFIVGEYDSVGVPVGNWNFFDDMGKLIQTLPGDSIQL